MLSDQLITEFMSIYQEEIGEELDREMAISHGMDLVRLLAAVKQIKVKKNYEPNTNH